MNRKADEMYRDVRRLKDSFAIQLKRNEWMINSLSRELEEKEKMLEFELKDLKRRVEKGELADRIGRWVEIYSRRTLTTEPEFTQTLRDIREWSEKVDGHISKDDKFTWIIVLLLGLFGAAVLVCRQANVVAEKVKKH